MEINAMAMRYSLYPALDAPFYNTRHPALIEQSYPYHCAFDSSLRLLRLPTHRHSFLLAKQLHEQSPNNITQERNSRCAHIAPYLDTDGTQRRAGERQHPLHIVGEPVSRQRKDGCLGVPELQEHFEAVCAEPAGAFDAPVE